jgi:uncharacterized membrane protein YoaK (UPF0700 family)
MKMNAADSACFMICIVCGIIDASCFVALGGTFAGLITGNLILMGVSLVGENSNVDTAVFLYPMGGYAIGALLAGLLLKQLTAAHARKYGLWVGWSVLLLVTIITWMIPIAARTDSSWLVVSLAAFYTGFQSAVLYLTKSVAITTNVMTSTVTSFLADYPTQLKNKNVSWDKLFAVIGFLIGIFMGAWLVASGVEFAFTLSLFLATLAIIVLTLQNRSIKFTH